MRRVSLISVTPVKCFALSHPESIELTDHGVPENRRFLLVDGGGRRLRSSLTSWPLLVHAAYDAATERLRISFPDGAVTVGSALGSGEPVDVEYHGRRVPSCLVEGEWNERLSRLAGHQVWLVRPNEQGRVQEAPVTLVSEASIQRLRRDVGRPLDGRRFRMLLTISGCRPHEEDEWEGRLVRIGAAVVRGGGAIERCAMTTRDPDSGVRDLDTLRLIKGYRGLSERGTIDFGVYARVHEPGRVIVGDTVEALP